MPATKLSEFTKKNVSHRCVLVRLKPFFDTLAVCPLVKKDLVANSLLLQREEL
jgi:hypothetical protein